MCAQFYIHKLIQLLSLNIKLSLSYACCHYSVPLEIELWGYTFFKFFLHIYLILVELCFVGCAVTRLLRFINRPFLIYSGRQGSHDRRHLWNGRFAWGWYICSGNSSRARWFVHTLLLLIQIHFLQHMFSFKNCDSSMFKKNKIYEPLLLTSMS